MLIFIRPIVTYTDETRSVPCTSRGLLETADEMRSLRRITEHSLRDIMQSEDIKRQFKVTNIIRWISEIKIKWNSHVDRIYENRVAIIT